MIEEAVHMGEVQQEVERGGDASLNLRCVAVTSFVADAERSQPESGGGDAGNGSIVVAADGEGAIFYQAAGGAGLLPEELERGALGLIQKFIIGDGGRRRGYNGARGTSARKQGR